MEEKIIKNLKNDFLFLAIIQIIILAISLFVDNSILTISSIVYGILLLVGYSSAKNIKKSAGSIGIFVGILMILTILTGNIIDLILGIFLVSHSVKYNKLF